MNAKDYAIFCEQRDEYPIAINQNARLALDTLMLVSSAGALANQVKKVYRDDGGEITDKRYSSIIYYLDEVLDGGEFVASYLAQSEEGRKGYQQDLSRGAHLAFLTLGLIGEAGEIAEKVLHAVDAGGEISEETRLKLAKEMGGTAWYFTRIASVLGYSVDDIFQINADELKGRVARGTILGDGDDR